MGSTFWLIGWVTCVMCWHQRAPFRVDRRVLSWIRFLSFMKEDDGTHLLLINGLDRRIPFFFSLKMKRRFVACDLNTSSQSSPSKLKMPLLRKSKHDFLRYFWKLVFELNLDQIQVRPNPTQLRPKNNACTEGPPRHGQPNSACV